MCNYNVASYRTQTSDPDRDPFSPEFECMEVEEKPLSLPSRVVCGELGGMLIIMLLFPSYRLAILRPCHPRLHLTVLLPGHARSTSVS